MPYCLATPNAFFGEVAEIRISDLRATSLKVSKASTFDFSMLSIVSEDLFSAEVTKSISSELIIPTRFCETFPNPIKPIIMIAPLIF